MSADLGDARIQRQHKQRGPSSLYGQPALPPIISFDSGSLQVNASAGTATYTPVSRGPVPLGDLGSSIYVSTENGTAIAGTDYTALNKLLVVFAPGKTTATFTVTIKPDSIDAAAGINPDFSVVLSDPINASIGFGTANTTIIEAAAKTRTLDQRADDNRLCRLGRKRADRLVGRRASDDDDRLGRR